MGKLSNKWSLPNELLIINIPVSDKKEIVESFNILNASKVLAPVIT
jgi:hypothetical protein